MISPVAKRPPLLPKLYNSHRGGGGGGGGGSAFFRISGNFEKNQRLICVLSRPLERSLDAKKNITGTYKMLPKSYSGGKNEGLTFDKF